MLIDDQLRLIAGAGKAIEEIGTSYKTGSITQQVLKSGEYHVVEDRNIYPGCRNCYKRDRCLHKAVLVYPIKIEGVVIGTISLAALDEKERLFLLSNQNDLLKFIEQISVMIGGTIAQREMHNRLALEADRFRIVINSIHEGIIAVQRDGTITHCNASAENLLQVEAHNVIGKPITTLFPDIKVEGLLKLRGSFDQELFYQDHNHRLHFLSTLTPISGSQSVGGLVISFRYASEIRKFAGKLIDNQASGFEQIIGSSSQLWDLKERAMKIALTTTTVFLRGESGTGKGLLARAIHSASYRRHAPFIAVNCGAIPETLLESELFGYEEGAFTGAKRGGKPGKFELANGGTIFLDEIGDMPLHLQVKLLHALEEKSIERVGGTKPVIFDVRIIAATNRNLEELVKNKEFREDLYYRLNVIPLCIPPLRERLADLQELSDFTLAKYNKILHTAFKGFKPRAREILFSYSWPGNVRELENAIQYAMNIETGDYISENSLPSRILMNSDFIVPVSNPQLQRERQLKRENTISFKLKDNEKTAILEALNLFGNTASGKIEAAKYLGISRATFYRRLKDLSNQNLN